MTPRERLFPEQLRGRMKDFSAFVREGKDKSAIENRAQELINELDSLKQEAVRQNDLNRAEGVEVARYDAARLKFTRYAEIELEGNHFEQAEQNHVEAMRLERELSSRLLQVYRDVSSSKYFDAESDEFDGDFCFLWGEKSNSRELLHRSAELYKVSALKYMEINEFEEAGDRYMEAASAYAKTLDIDEEGECIAYASQAYENVRDPASRDEILAFAAVYRATYSIRLADFKMLKGDAPGSKKASEQIMSNSRLAESLILRTEDDSERAKFLTRTRILSLIGEAFKHRAEAVLSFPRTERSLEEIDRSYAALEKAGELSAEEAELLLATSLLRTEAQANGMQLRGILAYEKGNVDEFEQNFQDAKRSLESLKALKFGTSPNAGKNLDLVVSLWIALVESLRLGYTGELDLSRHDFENALGEFRRAITALETAKASFVRNTETDVSIRLLLSSRVAAIDSGARFWRVYVRMVEVTVAASQSNDESALKTAEELRRAYAEEYFPIPGNPVKFVPTRIGPSGYMATLSLSKKALVFTSVIAVFSTIAAGFALARPPSIFFLMGSVALTLTILIAIATRFKRAAH